MYSSGVKNFKIEELREAVVSILSKTRAEQAYLFGSHARGSADAYSDVDLVIVSETDRPFVERFRDFFEILEISPVPV